MKFKKLNLNTAIPVVFVSMSLAFTACGDKSQKGEEGGGHEHGGGDAEGGHSHAGGGHMEHMNDVKAWLQKELGDQYDKPVPAASKAQLAQGKVVYEKICFTCHGLSGKGDGPAAAALLQKPADFTDSAHSKFYSDQGRLHIIKKGVEGTPMVAWEAAFSEDEIKAVYGYVVSLRVPDTEGGGTAGGKYVCPMHVKISSDKPGKCSKCGMALKVNDKKHDHGSHEH